MTDLTLRFRDYINYINNTRLDPLPVAIFDEDWEPAGPMIRADMEKADVIQIRADGIYLRPDLVGATP